MWGLLSPEFREREIEDLGSVHPEMSNFVQGQGRRRF
jgi:hypothetical protein